MKANLRACTSFSNLGKLTIEILTQFHGLLNEAGVSPLTLETMTFTDIEQM